MREMRIRSPTSVNKKALVQKGLHETVNQDCGYSSHRKDIVPHSF